MENKRTPVSLSDSERLEILEAMKLCGIRTMADFLRVAALEKCRNAK